MSAFIVEDRTINRVVSYINSTLQRDHRWLFDRVLEAVGTSGNDPDWQEKLGISMAMLNDDAMDARYRPGTAAGDRDGVSYKFHWEMCSTIQVLKSLQCWKYQCAEGDIPEKSPLYHIAEKLECYVACSIVNNLPEYDRAQWG